ncbi:hypothetical protein KAR91_30635 [Candidatus Pacearchaeota archaeon]|nr:hypothetical protein [Candidatus Pacearchaeota archaeon]
MTGAAIIKQVTVKEAFIETVIQGLVKNYAAIQNKGVPSSRIPFSGTGRRGGKSLYIEGLMRYVAARMGLAIGSPQNKGAAFAIAYKHKRLGMRIRERGQGSKWLDEVIDEQTSNITAIINRHIGNLIQVKFNKFAKDTRSTAG